MPIGGRHLGCRVGGSREFTNHAPVDDCPRIAVDWVGGQVLDHQGYMTPEAAVSTVWAQLSPQSRVIVTGQIGCGKTTFAREISIAYYTLFSTFPLVLSLIIVAGSILEADEVQKVVTDLVTDATSCGVSPS